MGKLRRIMNSDGRSGWLGVLALALMLVIASGPAWAERRVALVVGNGKYEKVDPLRNAQRDAGAVADRLRDLGFEVTEVFDGDAFALNRAADRFVSSARGVDLALFYFAGHGIQLFDRNVLLARDADPRRAERVDDLGLDLTRFTAALRQSGAIRQALLIDACRDNPFSFDETVRLLERLQGPRTGAPPAAAAATAARNANRGLASVALPRQGGAETLMFFAAQPGQVSFDGAGQNSYFVEGLKEELAKPGRPLGEVFRGVSAYVRTVTNGGQVPQVVSDWTADVALGAGGGARVTYDVHSNVGRDLTPAERELVVKNATGFGKFNGDFIAKASISGSENYDLTDAERKRATELGTVTGFSIAYDLDRDGRDETINVFFRQTSHVLTIQTQGVLAEVASCLGDAQRVEVALKDINGDRRPELFVAFEGEDTSWGTFCVLEYKGLPDVAARRRDNTGKVYAGYAAFRTLLRGDSGWGVAIANDNTMKACGGSNCHTSWTWKFDGHRFTLTDEQGAAPKAGAALPFRDEGERARNIFNGLLAASRPVSAQVFQQSSRNNTIEAAARIDARTELALECTRMGDGTPHEALIVRDRAPKNATGEASFAAEPTLAYGENLANAPVLIDGAPCTASDIATGKDDVRIGLGEEGSSACFDKLDRATSLTLPVRHGLGLLQVQLGGGASAIAAARQACRGRQIAALPPPQQGAPNPPPQQGIAGSALEQRARAFLDEYMRRTQGSPSDALSYMQQILSPEMTYYGKTRVKADQVLTDKRRYLTRWPERRYQVKPESVQVACEAARVTCRLTGELDYRTANAEKSSSGSASFELRVSFTGTGPRIVEESGRALARNP
jgi:uncharacterized caspase-like protein